MTDHTAIKIQALYLLEEKTMLSEGIEIFKGRNFKEIHKLMNLDHSIHEDLVDQNNNMFCCQHILMSMQNFQNDSKNLFKFSVKNGGVFDIKGNSVDDSAEYLRKLQKIDEADVARIKILLPPNSVDKNNFLTVNACRNRSDSEDEDSLNDSDISR